MAHISDIKLIRTDTTLDLSQKAEKGMICQLGSTSVLYLGEKVHKYHLSDVGQKPLNKEKYSMTSSIGKDTSQLRLAFLMVFLCTFVYVCCLP
ncbi:unnamed protein product [Arabidopsis halleri]